MSDTPSLADQINRLATALTANANLIPFQRRVLASLDQIEAILGRGVPLRRLATALAKAGLHDGSGRPLSEAHFRAAVSRARSRRRQTRAAPTEIQTATATDQRATPTAVDDFFRRQEASMEKATTEDKKRPDFSGGLFETARPPRF